jgi:hypothetical protein
LVVRAQSKPRIIVDCAKFTYEPAELTGEPASSLSADDADVVMGQRAGLAPAQIIPGQVTEVPMTRPG